MLVKTVDCFLGFNSISVKVLKYVLKIGSYKSQYLLPNKVCHKSNTSIMANFMSLFLLE